MGDEWVDRWLKFIYFVICSRIKVDFVKRALPAESGQETGEGSLEGSDTKRCWRRYMLQ